MTNNNSTSATTRPRRESPDSKLRQARLARGLAQVDLACASGVSVSWISVLERRPELMTERVAERLASTLGLPVGDLRP